MTKTMERIDFNTKSEAIKATRVTEILAIVLGTELWHCQKEEKEINT